MKIFNLFFLLAKKYKLYYIITLVYMVAFTLPMKSLEEQKQDANFSPVDVKISIINDDQGPIAENLISYLEDQVTLVDIERSPEAKADALFHSTTDYILTIPAGWSDQVLESKDIPPLDKHITSAAEVEIYIDTLIFTYMKGLEVHLLNLDASSPKETINQSLNSLKQNISSQVETQVLNQNNKVDQVNIFGTVFCTLLGYVALMTFIRVIGGIQMSTQNPEIVKRDRLSNLSEFARTGQLWLASLTWALIYWLCIMILGFIIFGFDIITLPQGQLYIINSLVSIIGIHGFAYFLAVLSKNVGVLSFLSIGLSLMLAFFSGIFVPLFLIHPAMQKLASIATPIWQVQTNEMIASLVNLDWANTKGIWINIGIQLLIALAYFSLSYIVQHHRLQESIYK